MKDSDRVGSNDNFNFKGYSIISASLREALPGNAKILWNIFTVMVLLHVY